MRASLASRGQRFSVWAIQRTNGTIAGQSRLGAAGMDGGETGAAFGAAQSGVQGRERCGNPLIFCDHPAYVVDYHSENFRALGQREKTDYSDR